MFLRNLQTRWCGLRRLQPSVHTKTFRDEDRVSITQYIASVIDAYLDIGLVNQAAPIFDEHRRGGFKFEVTVYNKILDGWLEQENSIIAETFLKSMKLDKVLPDLKTYGILLNYYARIEDWNRVDEILAELSDENYSLSDVLRNGNLSKDEANQVVKIMSQYNVSLSAPERVEDKYPKFLDKSFKSCGFLPKTCVPKEIFDPSDGDFSELMRHFNHHMEQEKKGSIQVPSITGIKTKKGETKGDVFGMISQWRKELTAVLSQDIEECLATCEMYPIYEVDLESHFPLLTVLPAKVWSDILIDEAIFTLMSQPNGLATSYLCNIIGKSAEKKINLNRLTKHGCINKITNVYRDYLIKLCQNVEDETNFRVLWKQMEEKYLDKGSMGDYFFMPYSTKLFNQVAASVAYRFLEVALIPEEMCGKKGRPGFEHVLVHIAGKRVEGRIRPTANLMRLLAKMTTQQNQYFALSSNYLPTLVPPVPWTSIMHGAFALSRVGLVRVSDVSKAKLYEENLKLGAVYDAVNYVSSIPWTINTKVLDIVLHIFKEGGNEDIGIPTNPYDDLSVVQRHSKYEGRKIDREQFSMWMDMFYRLSLAQYYRNEIFWLPHDLDFRGRCYPISTHLSHITMDTGRALFQFSIGESLGDHGLKWLKLHIMNMHGLMKKESMITRLEYLESILSEVYDSAKRPLNGNKWWMKGDNPFQVLATCIEYTNAVESGDPSKFVSYLPVHQDGSCNGLQHYSALGRDDIGARMVNLVNSEKPSDTYTEVANLVEQRRALDAESGNILAQSLENYVTRKVVKQTVMTTVYGVTYIGARMQIKKKLPSHFDKELSFKCSMYLVGLVFDVLSSRFYETRQIQKWLEECASVVSSFGYKVQWITPLGLLIIQPYQKQRKTTIRTVFQDITAGSFDADDVPDTRKQRSAFPPNFVHSIDACHMMMTALGCKLKGIPFVAVHDSFWTNAAFVGDLNQICREQFLNLHKEPLLKNVAEYFEERYGNLRYISTCRTISIESNTLSLWISGHTHKKSNRHKECSFPTLPPQGTLNLEEVLHSTYFFS